MENRKHLYVVEGNTDEDRLKKLHVTYIIKTGGKFIRPEILLFLKEVSKKRDIILLTDPDGPGRDIARHVQNKVGNCITLKAEKKKAIYHDKVGIAEMKLIDIEELIHPYLEEDKRIHEEVLTNIDMVDFGLIGNKEKRMKLIGKYHIPYTSSKNVLDCLNMLAMTKDELKKELTE